MQNLMWNLLYVKLDMMCWCCNVELLPNIFFLWFWKNKPEIITSCVYHLMFASKLILVCGQHNFCHLPDICNIRTEEAFLGNYPMLQFTTTISIAFALKLLDELWTEDPFTIIIRLHSTNNCQLLHLVKTKQFLGNYNASSHHNY